VHYRGLPLARIFPNSRAPAAITPARQACPSMAVETTSMNFLFTLLAGCAKAVQCYAICCPFVVHLLTIRCRTISHRKAAVHGARIARREPHTLNFTNETGQAECPWRTSLLPFQFEVGRNYAQSRTSRGWSSREGATNILLSHPGRHGASSHTLADQAVRTAHTGRQKRPHAAGKHWMQAFYDSILQCECRSAITEILGVSLAHTGVLMGSILSI